MNIDEMLLVTDIQRFCMHDGPGMRTTVFLKGCPMRCKWCHNPETQKRKKELLFYKKKCIACRLCESACPNSAHIFSDDHFIDREKCKVCGKCAKVCPTGALEICGKEMTVSDILSVIEKDRAFYGKDGGVTVSGGEPLLQSEAVINLLKECKNAGITTAVETCGYVDKETIEKVAPFVDLFLWDLKDTDDDRHKGYTGVSNRKIIENLIFLGDIGAKIRLRCIIVAGVNTDDDHYSNIVKIARSIPKIDAVELIPYHAYGGVKSEFIGLNDNSNKGWIPSNEEIERIKHFLSEKGIRAISQ